MRPDKQKASKKPEPLIHYNLLFHEENPDLVRIQKETDGVMEAEYAYNAVELGGTGACNCDHFYRRVYFKRRQLIVDCVKQSGSRVALRDLEKLKKQSGTCIHETLVDICYAMTELVKEELEARTGEERWTPKSIILISATLNEMHEAAGITNCSPHDNRWVKAGIEYLMKGLKATSPAGKTPSWVWSNKTILERAGNAGVAFLTEELTGSSATLAKVFEEALPFISSRAETSTATTKALVDEFLDNHYEWLSEAYKQALRYTTTKEEQKTLKLTFLEIETLTRHGGAAGKMASLQGK